MAQKPLSDAKRHLLLRGLCHLPNCGNLQTMSLYVMRRLSKKASANAGVAAQRTLSNKRTQCERNYLHLFFPNGSVRKIE